MFLLQCFSFSTPIVLFISFPGVNDSDGMIYNLGGKSHHVTCFAVVLMFLSGTVQSIAQKASSNS